MSDGRGEFVGDPEPPPWSSLGLGAALEWSPEPSGEDVGPLPADDFVDGAALGSADSVTPGLSDGPADSDGSGEPEGSVASVWSGEGEGDGEGAAMEWDATGD